MVIPPLPNSSVASPLTRWYPVTVEAAAPDRMRLALSVVPLDVLPCRMNVPLLASVVAFTVIVAPRLVLPISNCASLVKAPPKVTELPPSPPYKRSHISGAIVGERRRCRRQRRAARPEVGVAAKRERPVVLGQAGERGFRAAVGQDLRAQPSSSSQPFEAIDVIPPLPNSSVASPPTRSYPVTVAAAFLDRMRLASLVVPLAALPCRLNVPSVANVVAFTVVEALRAGVADVERSVVGQGAAEGRRASAVAVAITIDLGSGIVVERRRRHHGRAARADAAVAASAKHERAVVGVEAREFRWRRRCLSDLSPEPSSSSWLAESIVVLPPLPNSSRASPLTRWYPVTLAVAAPDRTRLASSVVPLPHCHAERTCRCW